MKYRQVLVTPVLHNVMRQIANGNRNRMNECEEEMKDASNEEHTLRDLRTEIHSLKNLLIPMDLLLEIHPKSAPEQNETVQPYNGTVLKRENTDERKTCYLVPFEVVGLINEMAKCEYSKTKIAPYFTGSVSGSRLLNHKVGDSITLSDGTWIVEKILLPSAIEAICFKETETITAAKELTPEAA